MTAISISGKEWRFPPEIQVDSRLVEAAGGSELLAKLLIRRGIKTAAEAKIFLDSGGYQATSPMELADMDKAVMRVSQAIAKGEHVTVYGDYDVDGITGTAVLVSVLRLLGANVDFYIPNRVGEGYGLNLKAVSVLASKRRTRLIITCDCGIANFAEISFAKSLGVDTIIADHHSMPELLPPAVAILHPKFLPEDHPLHNLPGVGVAYKLCEALLMDNQRQPEVHKLLDYVTLGMIADMVPLVKENRYLVQIGLPQLVNSPRLGIKALLSQINPRSAGTDVVGFGLAPRINAMGRLADANLAVELMTTDDPQVAEKLAQQLQLENSRRQELCEKILQEAEYQVATKVDLSRDRAIVVYKDQWHYGVVGIVASRLVEKYHCPAFVGGLDPEEGIVKGSARSVEGVDLYQVLKDNQHLLTGWGGHKMAAGFTLMADKAEVFSQAIVDTCNRMLADKSRQPVLDIDAVVGAEAISPDLVNTLSRLAPFGMSNKKPVLVAQALRCVSSRALGKEGKHSRIMLEDAGSGLSFESVLWNSEGRVPAEGLKIDIAFTLEINSYNGRDRLQLVLCDWRDLENRALPKSVSMQSGQVSITQATKQPPAQPATSARQDKVIQQPAVQSACEPSAPNMVQADLPRMAAVTSLSITWKDLRNHETPQDLLPAAVRKLGDRVAVFGETCAPVDGLQFVDRINAGQQQHLLLWQYPPSRQVFQSLLAGTRAGNIYLIGGCPPALDDTAAFIRRLLGLARFAVNQKEGKVEGEKLAAVLGTTKMCVALGLTILRKLSVIDWFAEGGVVYIDILDQPAGKAEELAEFRQLSDSLKEIFQFRTWCAEAKLKDIQLTVAPNQVELPATEPSRRDNESCEFQTPTDSEPAGAV